MANRDIYPCYVKIVDHLESDDVIELPTNESGFMDLSTLQAQYPNASGLRFKDGSAWKGITLEDGALHPPEDGWGEKEFFVTLSGKRKSASGISHGPDAKVIRKTMEESLLGDLIVLGLHYSATEDVMKSYFEQFGELEMHEVKSDENGKSKGFGFIRYKSAEVAKKVLDADHVVAGRRCEVRLPKGQGQTPQKLFVGRLKEGTTTDHLLNHFSKYGELKDVYIPKNFRGFGFVTMESVEAANQVMQETHLIEGSCVNVTYAEPRGDKDNQVNTQLRNNFNNQQPQRFNNNQQMGYNIKQTQRYGNQGYKTSGSSSAYNPKAISLQQVIY